MADAVVRHRFLQTTATFGLGGTLFPGVLWAMTQSAPTPSPAAPADETDASAARVTRRQMIDAAATIARGAGASRQWRVCSATST